MSRLKAYGEFLKRNNHTFRTSAFIQWGTSDVSLGSCLLLNPGAAELINPLLKEQLNSTGRAQGQIKADPTMDQLINFVERIYDPSELDGRLHIYNLFTLQNSRNGFAIAEFEKLVASGEYDPFSSLVDIRELTVHPWILLAWGCNEESFPPILLDVKTKWLERISQAGLPAFGKQHPEGKGYYHPCPRIPTQRPAIIDDFVKIYQRTISEPQHMGQNPRSTVHVFSVADTRPAPVEKSTLVVPDINWLGWTIMKDNPEDVVRGFSHLTIDPRYKLRAYQCLGGIGAHGKVWAIPREKELPHPADCEILDDGWNTPKPSFALDDFMEAIRGDKTPISYLQAAVLVHELAEFGAAWHGIAWGTHRILPFDESLISKEKGLSSIEWTMQMDEPEIWEPHFYYSAVGQPIVVFHTYNPVYPMSINRLIHIFSRDNYTVRIRRQVVASAPGGMIF
jgi:hypothetical protein